MSRCLRGRRRVRRYDAMRAGVAAAVLGALLAAMVRVIGGWEHRQYDTGAAPQSASSQVQLAPQPRTLVYDGIPYVQRAGLETYLLLGIDVNGAPLGTESYIGGGQADVQLLLVVDHPNRRWQVLQLDRDSMVQVPVLGVTGKVVGTEFEQLALAYSYGNGREESCENTAAAVSALFNGQPIDGYIALSMDAVAILNDMVGGVPVTLMSDLTAADPTLAEGKTVLLQGEQALTFVRARRGVDDQTNISRMARQRQYLSAFGAQLALQDDDFAVRAYEAVADHMVTDMGSAAVASIGRSMKTYTKQEWLTIAGESRIEDGHVARYLDADSLQQTMIRLFYQKQSREGADPDE